MSRTNVIVCALVLAFAAGCNAVAGINDPIDPGTSGGAPGTTSGGPSPTSGGVDRFVGTWRGNRDFGYRCGKDEPVYFKDTFELVVAKSSDTTLTFRPAQTPDCQVSCSVDGNKATALREQQCVFLINGSHDTYRYTTDPPTTFTINDEGTVAQAEISAYVLTEAGVQCLFAEVTTYAKE